MSYEKELEFAKSFSLKAGDIMKQYFRSDAIDTKYKSDNNPVTIADEMINDLFIEECQKVFPEDGIYGEEKSFGVDRKRLWVTDPLDGTVPYTIGLPLSIFMTALVIEGRPVVALAYNPWLDVTYSAVKGEGAFCNGKKLKVDKPLTKVVDFMVWGGSVFKDHLVGIKGILYEAKLASMEFAGGISRFSIAEGREFGLIYGDDEPWDIATLDLVVTEAGGKVTDLANKQIDYRDNIFGAIAGSKESHEKLLSLVKSCGDEE